MQSQFKHLFSPLTIGNLTLPHRLIQGPLAGYSCAPFRVITQRNGDPAFSTTEMISAKDLVHREPKPDRYLWRDPEEKIVSYQLSANEPDILAQASQIVTAAGADIIDLNCGCPVKKIRAKGTGSKLLEQPDLIHDLVKSMKANTDAVISVKIRVSEPVHDSDDIEIAKAAVAAGADCLTVHGRHWTERYDIPCRLEAIRRVVDAVDIPVFANGDVSNLDSLVQTLDQTQCAGIMIARASVGDPWLFKRLRAQLAKENFIEPTIEEVGAVFQEHVDRLCELEAEKLAVLQSRKLVKYYSRNISQRSACIMQMQRATTKQDIQQAITQFFKDEM